MKSSTNSNVLLFSLVFLLLNISQADALLFPRNNFISHGKPSSQNEALILPFVFGQSHPHLAGRGPGGKNKSCRPRPRDVASSKSAAEAAAAAASSKAVKQAGFAPAVVTSEIQDWQKPPEPTTSKWSAPQPAPVVPQAAAHTPDSNVNTGGGNTYSGVATFYDPGLGACGITNYYNDKIVAVSRQLFDGFEGYWGGNPNANPICNRRLRVTMAGGNSMTVVITDRCEACALRDLDFTPGGFLELVGGKVANSNTGLGIGRTDGLTWSFI